MRRYETIAVLDPDLHDDDVKTFTEKYSQLIMTQGGEVIKVEDWGTKKLAYLVRKRDKGHYILFDYVGNPALIFEMERQLKIAEDVMKYLSVKLDDEVDLEAFKQQAKPEEAAPEEAPAAETAAPVEAVAAPAAEAPVEAAPAEETEEPKAVEEAATERKESENE
ncbi:30S ribosomal protein S6 [Desulfomonile tiedjei]|uniref:Small ribosomal subunit protein bS6 n=1 Tax=Desulfomonile tiedjei (strain ATCC 49306 / DSM 6799 / DCB-1) TaxID=706587 RepID=I4C326_DESTA|nr:30S ribosomal protein S6 [Desulfomonile tiedjei]AFM23967.1 SSU ribosomal protein S6P [Desulfomonile tiedjei DSM 6799]